MRVEVLYFPGCPNHSRALDEVKRALEAERIHAAITEIEVGDELQAERHSFYGSPTIRVNGRDVAPVPSTAASVGLQCRFYPGSKYSGVPPRDLLRGALREAANREES
ncbi:MAG TPA: hypothetical protein VJN21_07470 [Candidatus Acidoferrales bacterium]|nr:hypothetical protein [Candidatus Acidoferrales bacterium]